MEGVLKDDAHCLLAHQGIGETNLSQLPCLNHTTMPKGLNGLSLQIIVDYNDDSYLFSKQSNCVKQFNVLKIMDFDTKYVFKRSKLNEIK